MELQLLFNIMRLPREEMSHKDMILKGYAVLTHFYPAAGSLFFCKIAPLQLSNVLSCDPSASDRPDIISNGMNPRRAIKRGHVSYLLKQQMKLTTEPTNPFPNDKSISVSFNMGKNVPVLEDEGRDNYLEQVENEEKLQAVIESHLAYAMAQKQNLYFPRFDLYLLKEDILNKIKLSVKQGLSLPMFTVNFDYQMNMTLLSTVVYSNSLTLYYDPAETNSDGPFLLYSEGILQRSQERSIQFFTQPLERSDNTHIIFCQDPAQARILKTFQPEDTLLFIFDSMYAPVSLNLALEPRQCMIRPSEALRQKYVKRYQN